MNYCVERKDNSIETAFETPVTCENFDIYGFTRIACTAGSNGMHGGDYGHGSRTFVRIALEEGAFDVHLTETKSGSKIITIEAGGDYELDDITGAFNEIVRSLQFSTIKNKTKWKK